MSRILITIITLVTLSVVVLMIGCDDTDRTDGNVLMGDYRWLKTTGGIAGVIITPDSVGYDRFVHFGYNWDYFENGSDGYEFSSTYRLEVRMEHDVKYNVVNIRDLVPRLIDKHGDTLILTDAFIADGFTYTYIKLGPI